MQLALVDDLSVREIRMGEFHSNIKLKTELISYWISAVPTKKKQLETWFETFSTYKRKFLLKTGLSTVLAFSM